MNSTTIATLMTTMTLLTLADSWMPTTSSAVMQRRSTIAGTLSSAPVVAQAPVAGS